MSTLEKIRNKSGFLGILVIFLVILFVMGDLFKGRNTRQIPLIAKVNGEDIPYETYEKEYQQLKQSYGGYYGNADFLDKQSKKMAFENIVKNALLQQEAKKIGLSIAKNEKENFLFGDKMSLETQRFLGFEPNTPDSLKTQTIEYVQDIEAGKYNTPEYAKIVSQWEDYKNKTLNDLLSNKLEALVQNGLFVNHLEAVRLYEEKNKKVSFEIVGKKFEAIEEGDIVMSDAEIHQYYDQHKNEKKYQNIADAVSFKYVVFPIEPTENDQKETLNEIEELKKDWMVLVQDTSFITINNENRSLDIQDFRPNLLGTLTELEENSIKTAKVGTIFGPFITDKDIKLAKIKINGTVEERKASHILIKVDSKDLTALVAAQAKADSIKLLIKQKNDFIQFAKAISDDVSNKDRGGDLGWFGKGQMVKSFEDAVFSAPLGLVSTVVSDFGIHIIRVDSVRSDKKLKLAIITKKIEVSSQTEALVYNQAMEFSSQTKLKDFQTLAEEKKLSLYDKPFFQLNFDNDDLTQIQNSEELKKWLLKNKKNTALVSEPIDDLYKSFIVVKMGNFMPKGSKDFSLVEEDIRKEVLREKKIAQIKSLVTTTANLSDIAAALKENIQIVNKIDFTSHIIPEIGEEPKVVGTAFGLALNTISSPIVGEKGVYWINLLDYSKDLTMPEDYKTETNFLLQKYNSLFSNYFTDLQQNSKIEDLRLGE
jgi:peptidyl-prolyl cis-trans isomerase D